MAQGRESVYFSALAEVYDRLEPLRKEGYRFCHELALDFIPYDASDAFRLLDLGCGTGTFLKRALERYPRVRCVGIEYADAMAKRAEEKLKPFAERVALLRRDLNEGLPENVGTFQIAASFWAIHHLTDENKRRLLRQVREALEPDGWFFLADSVSARFEREVFHAWSRRYRRRIERLFPRAGVELAEAIRLRALKEHLPENSPEKDRLAPIASYMEWLHEAGFRSVDHIWHLWKDHFLIART